MVDTNFHSGGAPVDYSSPITFSQTQTAGYSPTLVPVSGGSDMSIIGGNGAALNTGNSEMNTCNLFNEQSGGKKKRKKSKKLKRSNKSRLSSKSRKSRSKSKVRKMKKISLRKSKRKSRRSRGSLK